MAPPIHFNIRKPVRQLIRIPGSGDTGSNSLRAVCINIPQISNFSFDDNLPVSPLLTPSRPIRQMLNSGLQRFSVSNLSENVASGIRSSEDSQITGESVSKKRHLEDDIAPKAKKVKTESDLTETALENGSSEDVPAPSCNLPVSEDEASTDSEDDETSSDEDDYLEERKKLELELAKTIARKVEYLVEMQKQHDKLMEENVRLKKRLLHKTSLSLNATV